ncbi:hypothetical protein MRX96_020212 [Rhipicephalus microplus]
MGHALIVDSILTPFSWYSLLPLVGVAAFLFVVAAYQRTQFYWITDRASDVMQGLASRFRKEAHDCPGASRANYSGSPGYEPETFDAASPNGIGTASQVWPMSAHGVGSQSRSVPALPVLIKVTDLSEWSESP